MPRGYPGTLVPAPRRGDEPMPKKVYGARVPANLADVLEELPDRAEWIRTAMMEKAVRDGLLKDEKA